MTREEPLILGIETSCDETAAAVVRGGRCVLSNVIASQHELHAKYAGVVPEIASRAHLERILPVVREALAEAGVELVGIDAVAVGHRPGLIGSLLVGVSAAKALAWSLGRPLVGVDHLLAHLFSPALEDEPVEYPAVGLVVSGGHSNLYRLASALDVEPLGRTIDDAIGEAYDKAATILELGFPGGPAIDRLAREGDDRAHEFPVARLGPDRLDFSFSGLKTALLYAVRGMPETRDGETVHPRDARDLTRREKADFAASFQRAAVEAVMLKVRRALERTPDARQVLVGGGVSANSRLRAELDALARETGRRVRVPKPEYCLDNAAMIAGLAAERFRRGEFDDLDLAARPAGAVA